MQFSEATNHFFESNKSAWQEASPGLKRQVIGFNDALMTVKVYFKQGAVGELHHHTHMQTSYIASGKFNITINGKSKILAQGDGFYLPPNVIHGAVCLEEGLLIDSFSPCREDFL